MPSSARLGFVTAPNIGGGAGQVLFTLLLNSVVLVIYAPLPRLTGRPHGYAPRSAADRDRDSRNDERVPQGEQARRGQAEPGAHGGGAGVCRVPGQDRKIRARGRRSPAGPTRA